MVDGLGLSGDAGSEVVVVLDVSGVMVPLGVPVVDPVEERRERLLFLDVDVVGAVVIVSVVPVVDWVDGMPGSIVVPVCGIVVPGVPTDPGVDPGAEVVWAVAGSAIMAAAAIGIR